MATPPLTEALMREALAALEAHGGNKQYAADALGIPRNTLVHRIKKAVQSGLDEAIVHPAPQGHTIKGVSTLYNPDGEIIAQWVKTRNDGPSLEEITEAISGAFETFRGVSQRTAPTTDIAADLATVYPLADWHIGLLAWGKETGEDWDLAIAKDVISRAMHRLIAASPPSHQAVVLGLGDLLHADNY